MAASSNRSANFGLTGIPLFIAIELALYGRGEQTHDEKMTHLTKSYSWLCAYLALMFEKKPDDYTKQRINRAGTMQSLSDVMQETAEEIAHMNEQYNPTFEGLKSCGDAEKQFKTTMAGVFERIALAGTFAGIFDKVSNQDEVYF